MSSRRTLCAAGFLGADRCLLVFSVLGIPYDFSIDVWSVACTVYELYTGKILFPGRDNNHMLKLQMDLAGKVPHKLLRKAQFREQHFDDDLNFLQAEVDKIANKEVVKKVSVSMRPVKDMKSRLLVNTGKMPVDELDMLRNFSDLLDKCLRIDPSQRISAMEALKHPFLISSKAGA